MGWGIIVWNVQLEAMRHCSRGTILETKRVSTYKVGTISVGIIQRVEEKNSIEGVRRLLMCCWSALMSFPLGSLAT